MVKPIAPLLFLLALYAFSACTNRAKHAEKFIFKYNENAGLTSLDPAFARDKSTIWATNQLYNGLVQMDDNLQIKPCIAHTFTTDSTGLHYTFLLRNDVYFHTNSCFAPDSTRTVSAHDFVYSLKRLQSTDLASPGRWTQDAVDSIWATSPTELHIKLTRPFPAFLGLLTMKYCSVVPHEAIEKYQNSFSQNPVGTGPFYMQAWHANEKLVLRKNPNYFETDAHGTPLPYADGVAITFITDAQAAFLEFLKGNNQLISGLDASYKDEILSPKGELNTQYAEKYVLAKQPYLNTEYLIFTVDSASTNVLDKRLRLAINMAINRQEMMNYLRNNIGKPATGGIIPVGLPGNIANRGYSYQPAKAKELIAAYKNTHKTLPEITLTTVANYRDLCEYMQSQLAKIGLQIKVDVIPPATLRELKSNAALTFYRASWIADYPDAENYLSLFYGPNRSPAGPNYSRFYSPVFDSLYTHAIATTDATERLKLYEKMDSLLVAEAPIVPLYYDEVVRIFPKEFTGLHGNAMNLLDLRFVKKN